jgi:hypothetical protein
MCQVLMLEFSRSFHCLVVLKWHITVTCMVSFGDSKHKPVKTPHRLLDVIAFKLALYAKCTIHDVVCPCFMSAVCLCGWAAILFGKFWLALGLVRLANVYGCEGLGILFIILLSNFLLQRP